MNFIIDTYLKYSSTFYYFFFFTFYSATGANNNKCDHWWRRRLAKFENFPLCLTHSLLISIKGFSLTLILRSQLPRICFFLSFLNLVLVYAALTTNVSNGERAGERYIFGGETHTHTRAGWRRRKNAGANASIKTTDDKAEGNGETQ